MTATLDLALQASGLDCLPVDQRPRLLSDNGPSYVAAELADWLGEQGMSHTRGKLYHSMTQGKIDQMAPAETPFLNSTVFVGGIIVIACAVLSGCSR